MPSLKILPGKTWWNVGVLWSGHPCEYRVNLDYGWILESGSFGNVLNNEDLCTRGGKRVNHGVSKSTSMDLNISTASTAIVTSSSRALVFRLLENHETLDCEHSHPLKLKRG